MNKAIVTGATGLVGTAVSRFLCLREIQVMCLGRRQLSSEEILATFGHDVMYVSLPMSEIHSLPEEARTRGWELDKNTVFYNFAWSGEESLADGGFGDQLANATSAAEAVKVAKKMKCSKFINSGSMEESFIEHYLNGERKEVYRSIQTYYGLAKLAARNMCKMISYLEKIDYIHTRMSVPLDANLSKGGYIASTLEKIFRNKTYTPPTSEHMYDIVLLDDVARAFYLIGLRGRNKADYCIGTGRPQSLQSFFEDFGRICSGGSLKEYQRQEGTMLKLFDTHTLELETSFAVSSGLEQILSNLKKS
jgi:nucleoside-diphosphate-sugar epimerase